MKNWFLITLAMFTLHITAQEVRKHHHLDGRDRLNDFKNISAEDVATLQTKRMTLALDLNESQQKEIQKLNLENATKRKAHMETMKAKKANGNMEKPSPEERFKMMNTMLDHKIAEKAKMKKILNADQFDKWEKTQKNMAHKMKAGIKSKRGFNEHMNPENKRKI